MSGREEGHEHGGDSSIRMNVQSVGSTDGGAPEQADGNIQENEEEHIMCGQYENKSH